jgi:hypothetical protein
MVLRLQEEGVVGVRVDQAGQVIVRLRLFRGLVETPGRVLHRPDQAPGQDDRPGQHKPVLTFHCTPPVVPCPPE